MRLRSGGVLEHDLGRDAESGGDALDDVVKIEAIIAVAKGGLPSQREVNQECVERRALCARLADGVGQGGSQDAVWRGRALYGAIEVRRQLDIDIPRGQAYVNLEYLSEAGPSGQVRDAFVRREWAPQLLEEPCDVASLAGRADGGEADDGSDRLGHSGGEWPELQQPTQGVDASLAGVKRVEGERRLAENGEVG